MGNCVSLYIEDEDDKIKRASYASYKREQREFHEQLRKQPKFSQLDIMGRGTSRESQSPALTKEQMQKVMNIIYDA